MSIEEVKLGVRLTRVGTDLPAFVSWLPFSWRGIGALIAGMLLARWTWILFSPQPMSVFPPKSDLGSKESEVLFGRASSSSVATNSGNAALGNVHLVGVFTGKEAFAVLKTDEKTQRGVALGDDVVKGTKLVEVEADHVVLEHDGVRQTVYLESKAVKNKDSLVLGQPSSTPSVEQAVAGWNQAHQVMQKDRTQMRQEKNKEVHQ